MKNRNDNQTANKLSGFAASILMCCFLYCLISYSPTSLSAGHSDYKLFSLVTGSEDSKLGSDALSHPTSPASQFASNAQIANWFLIDQYFVPLFASDNYLATRPINIDWFLQVACDRFRLSGWKDCSLLYKLINALI